MDNSENLNSDITSGRKFLKFSGIKNISSFKRQTNEYDEIVWVMDIDVFKSDLHILRFAKFIQNDYTENIDYGGYCYIIKGLPSVNAPKLKKLNINNTLKNIKIEKTEGKNTRVRCVF